MRARAPFLMGVVGGLLLCASFWVPPLAWIAIVPLGILVRLDADRRAVYGGAYAYGLAFFLPGTHWLRYCDPSAWMGWLLLSLYLALYLPAIVLVARTWTRRWGMPLLFALPIAWTAAEYLRMHLMTGFGWLMLAHNIHRWVAMIQVADFAGVYGVSFLIALVNALWVEALTLPLRVPAGGVPPRMRSNPAIVWRFGVGMAAVLAAFVYGTLRIGEAAFRPGPRLALVQTNLPQRLKENDASETLSHVLRTTRDALMLPSDLVVWPETSYPYYFATITEGLSDLELDRLRIERKVRLFGRDPEEPSAEMGETIRKASATSREELADITRQLKKPLLVGLIHSVFRQGIAFQYNAAVLYLPEKGLDQIYNKNHLVPFGEYLPLEGKVPALKSLIPYDPGSDFGLDASRGFPTLFLGEFGFACLICFEDTLPHIARAFLLAEDPSRPIDLFINQSNDGWFLGSIESHYHLAAGIFRSVECRRPMARVSNMGVTCVVDGNGRIVKILKDEQGRTTAFAGVLDAVVPLDGRSSLYVAWGDWLPVACLSLSVLGLAMSLVRQLVRIRGMHRARGSVERPP